MQRFPPSQQSQASGESNECRSDSFLFR